MSIESEVLAAILTAQVPADHRQQITVVVPVPTSEHIAQIVGKSGLKIKRLRQLTNTLIKTPLRGDVPEFIITGDQPNVEKARQAIQSASEFFTKLINNRSNVCAVGEVTILLPVPTDYVGVVVGRNGSVVNHIKQMTNTRINTPKDNTNVFEVTGNELNVLAAKEAIEERVKKAYELQKSIKSETNRSKFKFFDRTVGTSRSSSLLTLNSLPITEQSTYDTNIYHSNSFQAIGMASFQSYSESLSTRSPIPQTPSSVPSLPLSQQFFNQNIYF